ncbi:biotin synthase BioB [Anaerovorax sp. IOR16]|uniref:biotin synthase BioB n=1 Tax=Anaerovorax sp. IOR16 TaxID=2773458 RepID=UPI0019D1D251|nr:biotin synthase BioB [Anaerovorax sp. IOR16]
MEIKNYKEFVLSGGEIDRQQSFDLVKKDVDLLASAANEIRSFYCGNAFDLCTIINAKSGGCTEDCKYCAQSLHYNACIQEHPLLTKEQLQNAALYNEKQGILRFSTVTSGKTLSDEEVEVLVESYQSIASMCKISLCASHGLLTQEQFIKLKKAGLGRYHNNLETSPNYFKNICTTHTYQEKIAAIQAAQNAGLEVCSGGILGLGESMEDRIDMAFALKELHITSIPINILNPIKGTPFGNLPLLELEEIRRSIAIFRFILPKAVLRIAGGRGRLSDKGRSLFQGGANAAISGDMLTTSGISILEDKKMLKKIGFKIRRLKDES